MSSLLTEPDGFKERPLYISIDLTNLKPLNFRNIDSLKERDRFIHQATGIDTESSPGRKVGIIRVDSSGIHEIHPE